MDMEKASEAFLRAFLKGEVGRIVVVANLANGPQRAARRDNTDHYASNNQ